MTESMSMPYQEVCPMLRNKLRAMLAAKPNYQRLAYIESTGKQVIETGMKPNNNLTVFMDFQLVSTAFDGSNRCGCSYYADGHRYRPLKLTTGYIQKAQMATGRQLSLITADTQRHRIVYNDVNGNALYDGARAVKVYQTISPPDDVGVGVFGQCQTITNSPLHYVENTLVKMRLYELIGYDKVSGEEIYHAVPVLDSQGTPCLYDKVSGRFEYDMIGQEAFNYDV